MNQVEDAASVLEQFQQDVSNLPGEIHHLYEEIQAKDRIIQDCRNTIASRDSSIQKWIRMNGAGQPNPKQEAYCKIIRENYEKAEKIQAEKIAMAEKAALLFDRQVKRLDFKIRDLQNEGAIQPDPQLPSLLHNTSITTRLPPLPTNHSPSIPLHPLSGNIGPSTTIANNPIARLVQPSARQPSPLITALPPSSAAQQAAHLSALRNTNRSPSTDPSKRRRLNAHHLSIPATSSSLRQSSLGPGTPKASDLATSRGSSAGPSRPSNNKKPSARNTAPPHHRIGHLNPTATKKNTTRRRGGNNNNKKSGTPVSTGEEDSAAGDENDEDVEMEDAEDEGDGDDKKYCVCQSVSYGNMVACDNATCPYEWFHWSCVGVKQEPAGKWYCPDCRKQR